MQHSQRHGRSALTEKIYYRRWLILSLALLPYAACTKKPVKPNTPTDKAEFYAPIAGQVSFFKGRDMNPYWRHGDAALPDDLRRLADVQLVTQKGDVLTANDLKNNFILVSFFFTRCSGICPMVAANIRRIHEKIADHKSLIFVSISVDPENDKPVALEEFRERMHVPFDNWYFTTGDKNQIYALARDVFQADVTVRAPPNGQKRDTADFLHTESVYLLDKNLYLRGVYRTRGLADLTRLQQDIETLRRG